MVQNPTAVFKARRERLAAAMREGVAIVPTAPERVRNRDSTFPYRFDSYFYYLTGFAEPDAVLVVIGGAVARSILFCRPKNEEREIWDGLRYGPEGARAAFDMDEAFAFEALDEQLPALLSDRERLYFSLGADSHWDRRVTGWLNNVRARARTGVRAPVEVVDVRSVLDEMRLVKDEHELATMRRAAAISTSAHRRAMRFARPGLREYEVEAELMHEFLRHGAQAPAYSSIVATGANACVLHYVSNRALLEPDDLVLIDAGCELDGYASDITRTFPVSGRFRGAQKALYELVLAAQAHAIAAVAPGRDFNDPHAAAVRTLAQGMIDLGLLQGSLDAAIESGAYRRFYMHRTGHWLGLDVHDAGEYGGEGRWKRLASGMVLTVEPGIYVRPGEGVPQALSNIGIRIEDDVLVTPDGGEVLTAAAPKAIVDIEALMRDG
ncbi:MAG: aminopeptidase P N-terminal domain-containing protein [Burkholderiales bacterium]|nr:aminopeptidase P N-terminal domain-containing protein [Burkholderiales bacterium]